MTSVYNVVSCLYSIFSYMYVYIQSDIESTCRVIARIVKAGCHPVAIAQVVEH